MTTPTDLHDWLATQPPALAATIETLARSCARIAESAALGQLAGLEGYTEHANSQGEMQTKLDLFADECIAQALAGCRHVAGWASEEHDEPSISPEHGETGEYLVVFDPLDGSSNIDANISVGTIFSILPHPFRGTSPGAAGFLQPGRRQIAAGYAGTAPWAASSRTPGSTAPCADTSTSRTPTCPSGRTASWTWAVGSATRARSASCGRTRLTATRTAAPATW